MPTPAYAKQPKTIKPGAWVRFKYGRRWSKIAGTVRQVVLSTTDRGSGQSYECERIKFGRSVVFGPVFAHEVKLLTAEEAAPYIVARTERLERERVAHCHRMAAAQVASASGRSFYNRRRY
jgi:hypothetical protein